MADPLLIDGPNWQRFSLGIQVSDDVLFGSKKTKRWLGTVGAVSIEVFFFPANPDRSKLQCHFVAIEVLNGPRDPSTNPKCMSRCISINYLKARLRPFQTSCEYAMG